MAHLRNDRIRSIGRAAPVGLAALLSLGAHGAAFAQETPGGRTPSPPGAAVYFIDLQDGARLPPKATIRFGLSNMKVAPAGVNRPNTGHHHLLIDTDLPPLDAPVPNDFNHIHLGNGQTEVRVTLPPGRHTLQLLLADHNHVPHDPPVVSQKITIRVRPGGETADR